MKNKKGFTLIEMLVVIALIGVVIAIAIPSITLVRKRINIRLLNEKKDEILVAAQLYGSDKKFEQDTIIKVYELLDEKYIKKDTDRLGIKLVATKGAEYISLTRAPKKAVDFVLSQMK